MGLFDRRKKNTKTAMCISGKLRTASLTSQVGMVLDCRKATEDEGCPDYEDSPYMEIIKRVLVLYFEHPFPIRKKDEEVIFVKHNWPAGFGTVLEADNIDPETLSVMQP